jgi:DNA-binding transcriptional regulator YiaG
VRSAPPIRARLAALGLTQAEFAALCGLGLRTVAHWCAGTRATPGWALRVLDLIEHVPGVRENLAAAGARSRTGTH